MTAHLYLFISRVLFSCLLLIRRMHNSCCERKPYLSHIHIYMYMYTYICICTCIFLLTFFCKWPLAFFIWTAFKISFGCSFMLNFIQKSIYCEERLDVSTWWILLLFDIFRDSNNFVLIIDKEAVNSALDTLVESLLNSIWTMSFSKKKKI